MITPELPLAYPIVSYSSLLVRELGISNTEHYYQKYNGFDHYLSA